MSVEATKSDAEHRLAMLEPLLGADNFPFTPERVSDIEHRRRKMDNQLFIDVLLEELPNEDNQPIPRFPPRNTKEALQFAKYVLQFDMKDFMADCYILYLLAWYGDDRHIEFCETRRIPSAFAEQMYAYFFFDSGEIVVSFPLLS